VSLAIDLFSNIPIQAFRDECSPACAVLFPRSGRQLSAPRPKGCIVVVMLRLISWRLLQLRGGDSLSPVVHLHGSVLPLANQSLGSGGSIAAQTRFLLPMARPHRAQQSFSIDGHPGATRPETGTPNITRRAFDNRSRREALGKNADRGAFGGMAANWHLASSLCSTYRKYKN
jgi:hypothetical protein